MVKRTWALGILGVAIWGCGPPQIVPTMPPGTEYHRATREGDEGEALGEAGAHGEIQAPTARPGGESASAAPPTKPGEMRTLSNGLQYETLTPGEGPVARTGQVVAVHYVGTLTDGSKFDSSRDRGQSFSFQIGAGSVIPGWEQGVAGMQVGERRKLIIPPDLGYKDQERPKIPANSTLVFEIELMGIK
jgi:FKBP-type peptidyl-prolyl cis-trans isomerase